MPVLIAILDILGECPDEYRNESKRQVEQQSEAYLLESGLCERARWKRVCGKYHYSKTKKHEYSTNVLRKIPPQDTHIHTRLQSSIHQYKTTCKIPFHCAYPSSPFPPPTALLYTNLPFFSNYFTPTPQNHYPSGRETKKKEKMGKKSCTTRICDVFSKQIENRPSDLKNKSRLFIRRFSFTLIPYLAFFFFFLTKRLNRAG